jgi:hypothetical protein
LRDAVLVDLDLGYCRVHFADFADADMHGTTTFSETIFTSVARFDGARFGGDTSFRGVRFQQRAEFTRTTFRESVSFGEATFLRDASFEKAIFLGHAYFGGVRYFLGGGCLHHGPIRGENAAATFTGFASFQEAIFHRIADFTETTFKGPAYFQKATFAGTADFHNASFVQASKHTVTTCRPGTPAIDAVTADITFTLMFNDIRVLDPHTYHSWPPDWRFIPNHRDHTVLLAYVPEISTSEPANQNH